MYRRLLLLWIVFIGTFNFGNCDDPNPLSSSSSSGRHLQDINKRNERPAPIPGSYDVFVEEHQIQNVSLRRFRKNAPPDNLQTFLDRTSVFARLSNGITLQAGLMGSTISVDDAVGELLNFGSVKASDLAAINIKDVVALAQQLKQFPTSLDPACEKIEDDVIALNQIRIKSEPLKDVMNMPKIDEYIAALDKIKTIDFTPLDDPYSTLKSIHDKLEVIVNLKVTNKSAATIKKGAVLDIQSLGNYLDGFPAALGSLKTTMTTTLASHPILVQSKATIGAVDGMIKLLIARDALKNRGGKAMTKPVKANFEKIANVQKLFGSSTKDIGLLTQLAKSRSDSKSNLKPLTIGFSAGPLDIKQLARDLQEPWIKKVTQNKVAVDRLKTSLDPLFNIEKRLSDMSTDLDSSFNRYTHPSFLYLAQVPKEFSKFPADSVTIADSLEKITDCHLEGIVYVQSDVQPTEDAIKQVAEVGDVFSELDAAIKRIDEPQLTKDIDAFMKSFGFTDLSNVATSTPQVSNALINIRKDGKLDNFKKLIAGVMSGMGFNQTKLAADVKNITTNKDSLTFKGLDKEARAHGCLRNLKTEFEKIIPAIDVTKKLRKVAVGPLQNVEKAVTAVSKIHKSLSQAKSIPNDMKAVKNPEANAINQLKLPKDTETTIGSSVNSLRYANGLKLLKSAISDLKTAGATITKEIGAVKDPALKKKILSDWGDLDKEIATWDAVIKQIESVGQNLQLDAYKSMADYGKPFPDLLKVADLQVSVGTKIQALDVLIPLVKNPTAIQKSKDTLEQLDSLDLDFSSHTAAFNGASSALDALFNFLAQFSTVAPTPTPLIAPGGSPGRGGVSPLKSVPGEHETGPDYLLIGGVSTGSLIIGGLAAIAAFLTYKKLKKRVNKKNLRKWIRAQMFEKERYDHAFRCHEAYMRSMEIHSGKPDAAASYGYLPAAKHRSNERFCNPETALHHIKKDGKKMPIHANLVVSLDGTRFYATQAPTIASKPVEKVQAPTTVSKPGVKLPHPTDDTREDFWHMCMHDDADYIVQLCCWTEITDNEAEIPGVMYYPSVVNSEKPSVFGRYEVMWIKTEKLKIGKTDEEKKQEKEEKKRLKKMKGKRGNVTEGEGEEKENDKEEKKEEKVEEKVEEKKDEKKDEKKEEKKEEKVEEKKDEKKEGEGEKGKKTENEDKEKKEGAKGDEKDAKGKKGKKAEKKKEKPTVYDDVDVNTFEIKDTKGKFKKRVITHIHYTGWPDMKCPAHGNFAQALAIMKIVEKSKNPIVVHCLSGIGRTMAFIGLHVVSENVKVDPNTTMGTELSKLRACRWDAVQTLRQCYWLQVAVARKLNEDYKLGMNREVNEMDLMFYMVACKERGTPEFEAERERLHKLIKEAKARGEKYDATQKVTNNLGEVILY